MRPRLFNRRRREFIASVMLAVLALRLLIPVGFMPESGKPFSVTICHTDLPQPLSTHKGHSGNHLPCEHCTCVSAPAGGPAADSVRVLPITPTVSTHVLLPKPLRIGVRLVRVQQPRAPPSPA
jgi:hypothetical protein